jgi:peptidoglycan hydrolase-like protein with peptidoglycan-binding domain
MIKKYAFIVGVAAVLAIPALTLAATSAVAVSGIAVSPVTVSMLPVVCYPFTRSLSVGANGTDVIALQNYLRGQGDFTASSTGYFGVITEAAVGRWQAQNNVVVLGGFGNGTFGPLSRGFFMRLCKGNGGGNNGNGNGNGQGGNGGNNGSGNNSSTPATATFSANPQFGNAPLSVEFISTAPQGTTLGNAVNFGDGASANLGVVPVCFNCNAEGIVSHTYTAAGTYTATLTSGACSCPANGVCNCPNIQILATTTVVVNPANTTTTATSSSIQQLTGPGSVTLSVGDIAELRSHSAFFTLQNIASSTATIQVTPVGCWNSFPSDPRPKIVCMIALVPIPPQTLSVGQTYTNNNYSITLTQLSSSTATFAVE